LGRMAQVSIVAYLVSGTFLSLSYWDFYWTLLIAVAATHTLAQRATAQARVPSDKLAGKLAPGWRDHALAKGARA
jgi:putative inorganic carbon (HCO3(-)) transporter